jgi:hypothetical protein
MAVKTEKIMTELMDQAVETFDAAMKTGLKMQEEATKWWSDTLGELASSKDWQDRMQTAAKEAIPMARQNAEETLRLIDENTRTSLDLLKKAFESAQPDSLAEAQARTQELWEASLAALRKNAQAVVQANSRALESFSAFAKKNFDGKKAPAAAT